MAERIGGIFADFMLDAAGFDAAIKRSSRELTSNATRMNRALARVEKSFDRMGRGARNFARDALSTRRALTALIGAGGLAAAQKVSLDFADATVKLADRVGLSAEALQEYRHAADLTGVSQQQLGDAFQRLNRRVGLLISTGTSPAEKALERLGLAARINSGELRGTEPIFEAAVAGLQNIESAAERAAIASQLFGEDAGPKLVLLLGQGTNGIAAMRAEARRLGLVISTDMLRAAELANDKMSTLGRILKTQVMAAFVQAAPHIASFGQGLIERLPAMIAGLERLARALDLISDAPDVQIVANTEALAAAEAKLKQLAADRTQLAAAGVSGGPLAFLDRQIEAARQEVERLRVEGERMIETQRRAAAAASAPSAATGSLPAAGPAAAATAKAREDAAKAAEKQQETINRIIERIEAERDASARNLEMIDLTEAARRRAAAAYEIENELRREGIVLNASEQKHMAALLDQMQARADALEREQAVRKEFDDALAAVDRDLQNRQREQLRLQEELKRGWEGVAQSIGGAIAGTQDWKSVTNQAIGLVIRQLGRLAESWISGGPAGAAGGSGGGSGLFSGVLGSIGSIVSGAFSGGASIFHSGGVVGGPAPQRYAGADGRMRLASDEVPAILQKGETVIPRGGGSGSGGGSVSVTQHIAIDARGNEDIEPRLRRAMEQTRQLAVQDSLTMSVRLANQGGSYSKAMGRRQ